MADDVPPNPPAPSTPPDTPEPPRAPPRFVPTLTEVVVPGAPLPPPPAPAMPAPPRRPPPRRGDTMLADDFTRQLLRSAVDERVARQVAEMVAQELQIAQTRITARLAETVRRALDELPRREQ